MCYDMHSELVIAKAELAGGIADRHQDFKRVMLYNFEDELNEALIPPEERTTDEQLLDILRRAHERGHSDEGKGGLLNTIERIGNMLRSGNLTF